MYKSIPIDAVQLLRVALREHIDELAVRQLADSIAEYGQLNPITVRDLGNGLFELIAGRMRVAAVQLLGRPTIDANVINYIGNAVLPAVAENIVRTQMNPLEEARAVEHLHTEGNMSIKAIAHYTHRSTTWVQDRLMLCALPDYAQAAVKGKQLSIATAALLCRIPDEDYRKYLIHIGVTNGCTVQQAEAWLMDWTARAQYTNGGDPNQQKFQLPPLPPRQPQPCTFCEVDLEPHLMILIRICGPCMNEVQETKRKAQPT